MKKIILISYYFIAIQVGYSQSNIEKQIDIKSPNIDSFIKYGSLSSISSTGNLDYEIPLISTESKNVNPIDISIRYDASGFRPNKRSGTVGLNWYLNMGGVITRDINGMPDDQIGEPNSNAAQRETNGFIVGVRNLTHNYNNVFNFNNSDGYNALDLDYYLYGTDIYSNYEGNPDIFNFNFNGISGKFFMGNDGKIKVVSKSPHNLDIDISGMQNQEIIPPILSNPSHPSTIIITDENGTKYYFGGETKNLEYSINLNGCGGGSSSFNKFRNITAWHLYRILYNNGKVTNFIFRDDSALGDFTNPVHIPMPSTNPLTDFILYSDYLVDVRTASSNGDQWSGGIGAGGFNFSTTIEKIAILDQIIDDNFIIDFTYSKQDHTFNTRDSGYNVYPLTCITFGSYKDIKLDQIRLYTKNGNVEGTLVKSILFGYTYYGGTIHSRMFLTSLTESGKQPYTFEYNETSNLPKPVTLGIDHWGYWNGNDSNTNSLIPMQNYDFNYDATAGDFTNCTSSSNCFSRDPNFIYSNKGNLFKVNYPTGGYTSFEYEPHDYSNRLESRSINNYIPNVYNVTGICGGTRIKTISDFDGTTTVNIKNYEYKIDSGTSSGLLLYWPRYLINWKVIGTTTLDQEFLYVRSNPTGNITDTSIITYSQVSEITNGNGKKVTKFTDFISNPDSNESNFFDHPMGVNATPKNLARNYEGYNFNDKSIERGKPIREIIFDANILPVQQIDYVYNNNLNKTNNWSAKLHLSGPSIQSNKLFYYQDYLTSKVTTIKTTSGNIVSTENYTYQPSPQYSLSTTSQDVLSVKSDITSNNIIKEIHYKYPWDVYLANSSQLINFTTANIIQPISESDFYAGVKTFEKFTDFAKDATTNNILLPKNIYSAKFPNNLPSIPNIGTLEKKATLDSYDTRGNVTQYTTDSGITVSIIWGYNQTRPIAKIENATLSQIATNLGVAITVLQGFNETNLATINGLRNTLPSAMITTYSHIPLIGVSTITDPKGDMKTFNYDVYGRFINVKDMNGNILSENSYNYKH